MKRVINRLIALMFILDAMQAALLVIKIMLLLKGHV